MIAWAIGDYKWLDVAKELAETVLSLPAAIPWYTNMARAALSLVAAQRGDIRMAQEQYIALQPAKGSMVHYLTADRLLGLLARTIGQLDEAAAHFEDALTFCRRAGYRPELAWTCCDYADTLLQRNGPGDNARATSLLDEARSVSSELGMRPLLDRASAIQQQANTIKDAPPTAPAYPDGLTQREVEVLGLVAAGQSNSDIAEKLVLSVRTVERHISNIYAKINARGRADATAYALSHRLISDT